MKTFLTFAITSFILIFPVFSVQKSCDSKTWRNVLYMSKKDKIKDVYSKLKWQKIGNTENGEPMCAIIKGKSEKINIYLLGGVHGEEIATPKVTAAVTREVSKLRIKYFKNRRIIMIPAFNVDGLLKNKRHNADAIDLNRDFVTSNNAQVTDKQPQSVENRNLMKLFMKYPPYRIISIHQPYEVIGYDGPAKELAYEISERTGYKVQEVWPYLTPGSLGTYGKENKISVITLELPPGMTYRKFLKQTRKAVLFSLFDEDF